jgi:hypothetical protein
MFHYLFEAPLKVIDIDKVALELQELNKIANTDINIANTNNNILEKDLKDLKGGLNVRNYNKRRKRNTIRNKRIKTVIKGRRREKTVKKR